MHVVYVCGVEEHGKTTRKTKRNKSLFGSTSYYTTTVAPQIPVVYSGDAAGFRNAIANLWPEPRTYHRFTSSKQVPLIAPKVFKAAGKRQALWNPTLSAYLFFIFFGCSWFRWTVFFDTTWTPFLFGDAVYDSDSNPSDFSLHYAYKIHYPGSLLVGPPSRPWRRETWATEKKLVSYAIVSVSPESSHWPFMTWKSVIKRASD